MLKMLTFRTKIEKVLPEKQTKLNHSNKMQRREKLKFGISQVFIRIMK